MFENIESFYKENHFKLIEDKSEGSLRPGKSFTKDVENCINKFSGYYKENSNNTLTEQNLQTIIGEVDTNTRSQNLRVMREFGFLVEAAENTNGVKFVLTNSFINFVESGITANAHIYTKLSQVSSIDDLSMYFNLLICTLREAYTYGQVMLFRDSIEKFKQDVPSLDKRREYRKRIFDIYGYSGRDKTVDDDVYSPNLSYMSRAELENLGLLIMTNSKIDNMNNLVLTVKGYELLEKLNDNLKCNENLQDTGKGEKNKSIKFKTGYPSHFSRNRILFGAPGTGKSFTINRDRVELLGEGNEDDDYERVTFHPDYSYANFVGTYKPVMVDESAEVISLATEKDVLAVLTDETKSAQEKYDQLYERFKGDGLTRLPLLLGLYTDESFKTRKADGSDAAGDNSVERNHGKAIRPYVNLSKPSSGKKDISYEYVPGRFMRMYVKALKNSRTDNIKPFLLIIEEINRANVAAVFGDIFQLLDRGDDFVSEYPIQATEDIKKYLTKELGGKPDDYDKIKIPDNMFIWATMNSADQGVFPMDTAFKRRWDFTYLGIDDNDQDLQGKYVYLADDKSQKVEWNKLRKAINNFLAKEKINEDKQLGPYFISRSIVVPKDSEEIDREKFINTFKNKVIMYLFEDAAKQKRPRLFEGCFQNSSRYSEICREFEAKGVGIFNHDIQLDCEVEDVKSGEDPQE